MIEFRNVSFSYSTRGGAGRPVLHGIDLFLARGRYVALMGPNGSGKSTLGKLVKGLLSPTAGQVFVGERLLPPGEISPSVGYIFSNPENQIISSVVEEDVAFGLENMGLHPVEIARRVRDSLAWVGMEEYRHHAPHLLSGGQQQKIVLAGILAMESQILVLDEPTSMLDLQDRREILDLLEKLHAREGKTLLHITHAVEEALRAEDLILLDKGRIAFFGSVPDFLSQAPWADESKIPLPPLSQLIRDLRASGYPIPAETRSAAELKALLLTLKEKS
jgi:energy-coupling factor transporter ATP-binding protein EcfA2